jgi:hypothetical protein
MNKIKIETPDKNEIDERGITNWGIWEKEPSEFERGGLCCLPCRYEMQVDSERRDKKAL